MQAASLEHLSTRKGRGGSGLEEMASQATLPEEELSQGHSSILAWRIPWTEEPGGPQSMGWQRVGRD